MAFLTIAVVVIAILFGVAYLVSYFAGPWLVTHVYETSALPDRFADDLTPDCPEVLVVGGDKDGPSLARGSGPPGARRIVLDESVLTDQTPDLGVVTQLATAEFDSRAYALRVFANLLRFELLFGAMAIFFWSAEADLQQSITTAAATIGGAVLGIVVVFYVLYRVVASRVYTTDETAARDVGNAALIRYLETKSQAPDSKFRAILNLTPPKPARISRLKRESFDPTDDDEVHRRG